MGGHQASRPESSRQDASERSRMVRRAVGGSEGLGGGSRFSKGVQRHVGGADESVDVDVSVGGSVGARASARATPPPSNRGGEHRSCAPKAVLGGLTGGRRIDFLRVSITAQDAAELVAHPDVGRVSSFDPKGEVRPPRQAGFRSHEWREVKWVGGAALVARHWDPCVPSESLGQSYEHWVFPGASAAMFLPILRGKGRPSRVDVAFDFIGVPSDLGAESFAEMTRSLRSWRYAEPTKAGAGREMTVYLGSRKSPVLVRIYRKDLHPKSPKGMPPTLRLEVELKDDQARCSWDAFSFSDERGFAHAAGCLERVVGFAVQDEREFWTERVVERDSDVLVTLAHFVRQYADLVASLKPYGFDLHDVCSHYLSHRGNSTSRKGRGAQLRSQLLGVAKSIGMPAFERLVVARALGTGVVR